MPWRTGMLEGRVCTPRPAAQPPWHAGCHSYKRLAGAHRERCAAGPVGRTRMARPQRQKAATALPRGPREWGVRPRALGKAEAATRAQSSGTREVLSSGTSSSDGSCSSSSDSFDTEDEVESVQVLTETEAASESSESSAGSDNDDRPTAARRLGTGTVHRLGKNGTLACGVRSLEGMLAKLVEPPLEELSALCKRAGCFRESEG